MKNAKKPPPNDEDNTYEPATPATTVAPTEAAAPVEPATPMKPVETAEPAKPTTPTVKAMPPSDPFDLTRLRLGQAFANTWGVKKALLTVPVRKPAKEWWVQVHPDPAYRIETMVLELKEDQETYLVAPNLWSELASESTISPRALFTTCNTQGVCFLWPVRLPGLDGKIDNWSRSALEGAALAAGKWVRVMANKSLGAYEVTTAAFNKEPAWPEASFQDLLRVAFKAHYIDTLEHPVLKHLRGES